MENYLLCYEQNEVQSGQAEEPSRVLNLLPAWPWNLEGMRAACDVICIAEKQVPFLPELSVQTVLGRSALLNSLPIRWWHCFLICLWYWGEQINTGCLLSLSRSLSLAPSVFVLFFFFTWLICRKINLGWSLISFLCFAPWFHSSQFQGASSKEISKCVVHCPRW